MPRFNFDALAQSDVFSAADASYRLIDRLQDMSPAEQVTAIGFLFHLVCEAHGADKRRVMETLDRAMRAAKDSGYHKVRAAEDYVQGVLR